MNKTERKSTSSSLWPWILGVNAQFLTETDSAIATDCSTLGGLLQGRKNWGEIANFTLGYSIGSHIQA